MIYYEQGSRKEKIEEEFYKDLSWIAQMSRGHIVNEIYNKWKDKLK